MKIRFSPIRMDTSLDAFLTEETLTLNGVDYDFSHIEEGQSDEDHNCYWVIGGVSRVDGELELTLLLPHGGNPPNETIFPQPVQVSAGMIPLPAYDSPDVEEVLE